MRIKHGINRLWTGLGHQIPATLAVVFLLSIQIAAFALPQIPVPPSESTAFSRWLAELQPSLGNQTRLLASLGLLTLRGSWLMRLGLALLTLVVAANLDALRESWGKSLRSRSQIGRLLICAGGILIIGGWGGQMLWGWRDPEVIAWPESDITLPERDVSIAQPRGPLSVWTGQYGLYTLTRGKRIGLEVQVTGTGESRLGLLPSVNEAPRNSLRIAFTTGDPEAFFAVPEAGLIFRLNQLPDAIQIQAYRSASGDLLVEHQLGENNPESTLDIDGVTATIVRTLLPRYEVVYNPGAVLEAVGLGLLAGGSLLIGKPPASEQTEDEPDIAERTEDE